MGRCGLHGQYTDGSTWVAVHRRQYMGGSTWVAARGQHDMVAVRAVSMGARHGGTEAVNRLVGNTGSAPVAFPRASSEPPAPHSRPDPLPH